MSTQVDLKNYIYTAPTGDLSDFSKVVYGDPQTQLRVQEILQLLPDAFPHEDKTALLLYGPPGTGKTTLAHMLLKACGAENIACEMLDCPGGYKGMMFVEKLIKQAQTNLSVYGADSHFFVLNEVDQLSKSALKQLRSALGYPNTIFIMTTNDFHEVEKLPSFVDRCILLPMPAARVDQLLPFARQVIEGTGTKVAITDDDLRYLVQKSRGSFRAIRDHVTLEIRTRSNAQTKTQLKVV